MTYSDEALIFNKIPVSNQVRAEDRLSYLYLEYCQIIQNRTGVAAVQDRQEGTEERLLQLPVAGLAVLFLGPGTSITQPAIASCTRSGLTVIFCGGGGTPCYSHATPLTSSARWAIAQARVVSDKIASREVAKKMYSQQLGLELSTTLTISQMRGIEGSLIKKRYRELAARYGVKGFKRDTAGDDTVNQSLNIVNGVLYGCAASACAALGMNPALGIIHRGDVRSLLFDLADGYKPSLALPIAFRSVNQEDPLKFARKEIRSFLFRDSVLASMVGFLMELFADYIPKINDDRLIDDDGEVLGHKVYTDNLR